MLDLKIRRLEPGDQLGILATEQWCHEPWDWSQHADWVKWHGQVTLVATHGVHVAGFVCVLADRGEFLVERIGVQASYRRKGVGRRLMGVVDRKFFNPKRVLGQVLTWDHELPGHLFLKACGWKAVKVVPFQFDGTADTVDAYLFEKRSG